MSEDAVGRKAPYSKREKVNDTPAVSPVNLNPSVKELQQLILEELDAFRAHNVAPDRDTLIAGAQLRDQIGIKQAALHLLHQGRIKAKIDKVGSAHFCLTK